MAMLDLRQNIIFIYDNSISMFKWVMVNARIENAIIENIRIKLYPATIRREEWVKLGEIRIILILSTLILEDQYELNKEMHYII